MPVGVVRQIVKGALVAASPIGFWGLLNFVLWVLSNPHIFFIVWMFALGTGLFAEYISERWGPSEVITPNVVMPSNTFSQAEDEPMQLSSRLINQPFDNLYDNNNTKIPTPLKSFKLEDVDQSVMMGDSSKTNKLSLGTTSLFQDSAPGVTTGLESKLPKYIKKRNSEKSKGNNIASKQMVAGITESFLNRNQHACPEKEWGAICKRSTCAKFEVLCPVTRMMDKESQEILASELPDFLP